jgi:hypothetical protein
VSVPSIKGTAFQSVHDDLHRLLESGRLSRERLELALGVDDLRVLDEKVAPAAWYPIDGYARMVELLVEIEARGRRREYLIERGTRAAERLSAAGIYQQLDASAEGMGPRVGHVILTLASVIYNFTRWSYESGEVRGDFTIRVDDAESFPEVSRFATQGFIQYVATRVSAAPVRVESDRPTLDRIVYSAKRAG